MMARSVPASAGTGWPATRPSGQPCSAPSCATCRASSGRFTGKPSAYVTAWPAAPLRRQNLVRGSPDARATGGAAVRLQPHGPNGGPIEPAIGPGRRRWAPERWSEVARLRCRSGAECAQTVQKCPVTRSYSHQHCRLRWEAGPQNRPPWPPYWLQWRRPPCGPRRVRGFVGALVGAAPPDSRDRASSERTACSGCNRSCRI